MNRLVLDRKHPLAPISVNNTRKIPTVTMKEKEKKERKDKIYIDFLLLLLLKKTFLMYLKFKVCD